MQILPRVTEPAPAKQMIGSLLSSIKSCGELSCEITLFWWWSEHALEDTLLNVDDVEKYSPQQHLIPVTRLFTLSVQSRKAGPLKFKNKTSSDLVSLSHPGSKGAFCELRHSDRRMLDFYTKLGSFKTIEMVGLPQNIVAMGVKFWTRAPFVLPSGFKCPLEKGTGMWTSSFSGVFKLAPLCRVCSCQIISANWIKVVLFVQ